VFIVLTDITNRTFRRCSSQPITQLCTWKPKDNNTK